MDDMDDVGRLIHHVGAREAVPEERLGRARLHVRAHWEQVVAENRAAKAPSRFGMLAIAASVVVALGASFVLWNLIDTPQVVSAANVDRILGDVLIADQAATRDAEITADTLIETGRESRIALRMAGGQSLRIDTASQVVVHSPNHVSLATGAIYIDTALAASVEPILVSTPMGTAQDVGTQFQVRLTGTSLVVGVRDGMVEVAQPGQQSLAVNEGRYVELDMNGERIESLLQSDDPSWSWIETVAPEFKINGATLQQYLEWFARERGVTLVWANAESEAKAENTTLSGSIAGISLEEGLLAVKRIAPFEYRFEGESIWVKVD